MYSPRGRQVAKLMLPVKLHYYGVVRNRKICKHDEKECMKLPWKKY